MPIAPPTPIRACLSILFCLVLAACGEDAASQRPQEPTAIPVTTATVREQTWHDTIRALGTAKAHESVTVTAKVSETVQKVHFDSGDDVRAGAPLVTLSGQQQQASLVAAEATATEAERLYQRQNELVAQQLIARSTLDTQRATRDAARAQVAQIRANLSDRVIRAPFAGVLGIRLVSPGALITPGTAVATLDDIAHVYIDFPVPEAQLARLAVGQKIEASSAAYPDRQFEGVVSTIDARVDAATRALTLRGDFANPKRELRPGMLLEVQLQLPERQALVIPEIAVVQVGNESYVFRVRDDGTVERADVELGGRDAGRVVVTKGLRAGERIVIEGTGKLRSGVKIVADGKPVPAPGSTPGTGQGRP